MLPEFGVGIKRFFFEQITSSTFEAVTTRINEQVQRYLPFLVIGEISYETSDTNPVFAFNEVGIRIAYSIPGISEQDTLQITATQNYL
jgi:hypothetical protein